MDNRKLHDLINNAYNDLEYGLIGVKQFYNKLKGEYPDITLDDVKSALSSNEVYTLNAPVRKIKKYRKIIVHNKNEQWQADLVFMDVPQGAPASENDGCKYLLCVIDVLTKYAWVKPLLNKTGNAILSAFKDIVAEAKSMEVSTTPALPAKLQVDKGTEFYNKQFEKYCKDNNIVLFSTYSDQKAAIVERFNRTLKMRMSKLFDVNQSFRYIDDLQSLVTAYNNTYHSTIKMKPIEAINEENTFQAWYNTYKDDTSDTPNAKYNVGDLVRIIKYKNIFTKELIGNWTIEIFKIASVDTSQSPVVYKLNDWNDDPISGIYYQNELLKVSPEVASASFRIEKELDHKTVKGKRYTLVKWLSYPEKFNSWVLSSEIKDIKKR